MYYTGQTNCVSFQLNCGNIFRSYKMQNSSYEAMWEMIFFLKNYFFETFAWNMLDDVHSYIIFRVLYPLTLWFTEKTYVLKVIHKELCSIEINVHSFEFCHYMPWHMHIAYFTEISIYILDFLELILNLPYT